MGYGGCAAGRGCVAILLLAVREVGVKLLLVLVKPGSESSLVLFEERPNALAPGKKITRECPAALR